MSVTISKIAQLSGVSRGTVDRVLHGRGKVNSSTEKKVLLCAKELGYKPNKVGMALAVRKKKHRVAVIICVAQNPFFKDVMAGIEGMEQEFRHYGMSVEIFRLTKFDPHEQIQIINSVKDEISGLIITPIDHPNVKELLNKLKIPIVNLNTDIEGTDRIAYVGTDYKQGGKIAAGAIRLLKPCKAFIGIVNGSQKFYGHKLREKGFTDELKGDYSVLPTVYCEDDDVLAFEVTSKLLTENPKIDALFIAAAGVHGSCRAVISSGREDIVIVCFDATETSIELIKKGLIKVVICQNPMLQGKQSMQIMLEFLVTGLNPEPGNYIIEHQIKIKQNY